MVSENICSLKQCRVSKPITLFVVLAYYMASTQSIRHGLISIVNLLIELTQVNLIWSIVLSLCMVYDRTTVINIGSLLEARDHPYQGPGGEWKLTNLKVHPLTAGGLWPITSINPAMGAGNTPNIPSLQGTSDQLEALSQQWDLATSLHWAVFGI